jgi:hypothetical protein
MNSTIVYHQPSPNKGKMAAPSIPANYGISYREVKVTKRKRSIKATKMGLGWEIISQNLLINKTIDGTWQWELLTFAFSILPQNSAILNLTKLGKQLPDIILAH